MYTKDGNSIASITTSATAVFATNAIAKTITSTIKSSSSGATTPTSTTITTFISTAIAAVPIATTTAETTATVINTRRAKAQTIHSSWTGLSDKHLPLYT